MAKETEISRPNLFSLATKELSQDAFLGWLMQWAEPQMRTEDLALHEAGKDLIDTLLGEGFTDEVKTVHVQLQWKSIDVLAIINGCHFILIEDKTYSSHHSSQLSRYKESANNWAKDDDACADSIFCLHPIYLKTGNEPQNILQEVSENGYRQFLREDILAVLERHQEIDNAIYQDYLSYLQQVKEYYAYETIPVKDWGHGKWEGFFMAIEDSDVLIRWHWVNNMTGGFMNGLMTWDHINSYPVYMQLEEDKLCFKVKAACKDEHGEDLWMEDSGQRRQLRNEMHDLIMHHAKKNGKKDIVHRPERFGNGYFMTLAYVNRDDWMKYNGECVDKDETIKSLGKFKTFYEALIAQAPAYLEKSESA